ncbi:pyrroline-5-carboxylate reductase [Diaporthe helianthi]|uniref:Pyrroline-5-carboxylate reductase n=1 Tax=Diaporthe helianthi TaxID=158607 RepID=A0A2P5HN64_DIAHE|nr:pyrroline-5-carboxylate reductase [Diaporthe helianthi]
MSSLCVQGCGNLGTAILTSLVGASGREGSSLKINRFIACVRSEQSEKRLRDKFAGVPEDRLRILRNQNATAVRESDVVLVGADPADVRDLLTGLGLESTCLMGKLFISIVAGWTRQDIEACLPNGATSGEARESRAHVVRTLPNIAATVGQSITAIESPDPSLPQKYLEITESIFNHIGKAVHLPPRQLDAFTAVGGSTPAFFAVIVDALIDSSVAVGMPRKQATEIIVQSMLGTATLLQSGIHPSILRDQGTSPEGCTIGGLMVLEEAGVRGHVGRGLREAVTIARLMGKDPHVNDTRH